MVRAKSESARELQGQCRGTILFHSIKIQFILHCSFLNVAGAEQALFDYI